jgi:hypothetical protein
VRHAADGFQTEPACPTKTFPGYRNIGGATMTIIAFLTNYAVVDRIIDHLKLTFIAKRPPPTHLPYQEVSMAAEVSTDCSS